MNHKRKHVFFGAWKDKQTPDGALILGADWKISKDGRSTPSYPESLEHLRLVTEAGYQLRIFTIIAEDVDALPRRIQDFGTTYKFVELEYRNGDWYGIPKE